MTENSADTAAAIGFDEASRLVLIPGGIARSPLPFVLGENALSVLRRFVLTALREEPDLEQHLFDPTRGELRVPVVLKLMPRPHTVADPEMVAVAVAPRQPWHEDDDRELGYLSDYDLNFIGVALQALARSAAPQPIGCHGWISIYSLDLRDVRNGVPVFDRRERPSWSNGRSTWATARWAYGWDIDRDAPFSPEELIELGYRVDDVYLDLPLGVSLDEMVYPYLGLPLPDPEVTWAKHRPRSERYRGPVSVTITAADLDLDNDDVDDDEDDLSSDGWADRPVSGSPEWRSVTAALNAGPFQIENILHRYQRTWPPRVLAPQLFQSATLLVPAEHRQWLNAEIVEGFRHQDPAHRLVDQREWATRWFATKDIEDQTVGCRLCGTECHPTSSGLAYCIACLVVASSGVLRDHGVDGPWTEATLWAFRHLAKIEFDGYMPRQADLARVLISDAAVANVAMICRFLVPRRKQTEGIPERRFRSWTEWAKLAGLKQRRAPRQAP